MINNTGLFKAIVTDNSNFFSTGKIKVRVHKLHLTNMQWDLSEKYEQSLFEESLTEDLNAYIYTPIGGGSGHGLFTLPQINSVGLIQFLNGNVNHPVWMGSFFEVFKDEQNRTTKVNIPNDILEAEGAGSDGITRGEEGPPEKRTRSDHGALIFRQKKTNKADGNATKMNWDENRTENLFVLNEEGFEYNHITEWENENDTFKTAKWEYFKMGKKPLLDVNGEVLMSNGEPVSIDQSLEYKIRQEKKDSIIETGFSSYHDEVEEEVSAKLTTKFNEIENEIIAKEDSVYITSKEVDDEGAIKKSSNIELTPTSITLKMGKMVIIMEGDDLTISNEGGNVNLSGKEVILGNSGGYVVTKNSASTVRLEDGTVLNTSNVRA